MDAARKALQAHLRELWDDPRLEVGPLREFGEGHSGYTYAVELGGRSQVLRLSPPGLRIAGPADVGRQGRIMGALSAAGLPTPRVLACSSEPVIDGRAFALMELVEGRRWPETSRSVAPREAIAAVASVVTLMQDIPPAATGIGDEEPTTPQAELERWTRLMSRAPAPLQKQGAALCAALAVSVPQPSPPVLVHGDLYFGNLLFDGPHVTAVLDWEIAQLGEPLLDSAGLTVSAIRRRHEPAWKHSETADITPGRGARTLRRRRCRGGVVRRARLLQVRLDPGLQLPASPRGKRPDPVYEELVPCMGGLLDDGMMILDGEFHRLAEGVRA